MAYYSGDVEADLDRVAWYSETSNGTTHSVGERNSRTHLGFSTWKATFGNGVKTGTGAIIIDYRQLLTRRVHQRETGV